MSCWVAPQVAAEYWHVSIDVVWSRIYSDQVPHKTERGFVFVDVAPWSADSHAPAKPPPTFVTALSQQETELLSDCSFEARMQGSDGPTDNETQESEALAIENEDDLGGLDDEESATFGRLNWYEVRQQVARTRRPPSLAA